MRHLSVVWASIVVAIVGPARSPDLHFKIHMIDPGASETAAVADINGNGLLDIISGDSWYEAPNWTKHQFRELGFSHGYIDSFSVLPVDVDGDGFTDIVDVSFFGRRIAWWRNPGTTQTSGPWEKAIISQCCSVEFAILADMNNNGRAEEIVAQENGTGQSWYEIQDGTWVRHVISDRSYGHGIGAGDVNGDGRTDILTPRGWLEAPEDPRAADWEYHPAWEAVNTPITPRQSEGRSVSDRLRVAQLGFMHVLDVNGNGRNDVVTAAAHDYGVFWFEQGPDGQWKRWTIDSTWSQGHASTLVDLNGDGRLNLVTGKRFMAHNGTDPGEREPLGVYWYEFRRQAPPSGLGVPPGVEWIRHVIDYGGRVGCGMQIPVMDIDGDGDLDVVCPGKSGLFLIENLTADRR
jgi:hypothetical protein